ncbi:MAG: MFS transporter [Acidimicrobiales bacterium]
MTTAAGEGAVIGEEPTSPARPPLLLIFTVTVTGILHNTLLQPAIPDILRDFDASAGTAGVVVAAGTVAGVVAAPVIGVLADQWGRRAVLVPCLVGFGVFGGLQALAPNLTWFLVLRFLQGVGGAGLINLAVTLIGDHWDGLARSRAVAHNAAVLTVSLAVFPPVGGFLTDLGTWRYAVAPYAVGLVTAALVWTRLPAHRPERRPVGTQLRAAAGYARHPAVLSAYAMGFVVFFLIFGLFLTALPIHLEEDFGLDAGARGLVLAVPALSSTIAALTLGRLRSRFDVRPLIAAGWACMAVAFGVIGVAPTLALLLAGAFVYGIGEGLMIPTLQDVVTGSAPIDHRSSVVALFVGVARFGQTVGPLTVGVLLAATTTTLPFVAGAAVALATMLMAAGVSGRRNRRPSTFRP